MCLIYICFLISGKNRNLHPASTLLFSLETSLSFTPPHPIKRCNKKKKKKIKHEIHLNKDMLIKKMATQKQKTKKSISAA